MMQWLIRRQALHAERFGRDADQVPLIIRCIAVGKHGESLRFLMGALLVKRLMHVPDLAATLSDPLMRVHIDPDGARAQRLPHRLLAEGHGGPVPVLPAGPNGGLPPADALYRVLIEGDDPISGRVAVRRVAVHIEAQPDSPGRRWLSAIAAALFRQGGF